MVLPYYQIDAFTSTLFKGNPAGVCVLEQWLDEDLMQSIAFENNLSETAFLTGANGQYDLRWFTPNYEVDLCGHGTLSAAYVVLNELEPTIDTVCFQTRSGELTVKRIKDQYRLDFPALDPQPFDCQPALLDAINANPIAALDSLRQILVLENEQQVRDIEINMDAVKQLDDPRFAVTAPGDTVDFVSRYFIPLEQRFEDPVTGSMHCAYAPYWAKKLNKTRLHARQLSQRGGDIICEIADHHRIFLYGHAVLYSAGHLHT